MIVAEDIYLNVLRAKAVSGCWAEQLKEAKDNGENIECCEKKFVILIMWISMLEGYYCQNYDENKSKITPNIVCLNEDQATLLLAKLKKLIGVS